MGKFRQGDLVLQPTQKITQDTTDILGANGVGQLTSLTFTGGGATVTQFTISPTLSGDSDTAVPTEKATKTYVDTRVQTAVPPGIDNSVIRYNGINAVQQSQLFIDDTGLMSGISSLMFDGSDFDLIAGPTGNPLISFGSGGITLDLYSPINTDPALSIGPYSMAVYGPNIGVNNLLILRAATSDAEIISYATSSPILSLLVDGGSEETFLKGQYGGATEIYSENTLVGYFEEDIQVIGGTRSGSDTPHMTFEVDNSNSEDVEISMGSGNNYYKINDTAGVLPSTHVMVDEQVQIFSANSNQISLGVTGDTNVIIQQDSNIIQLRADNTLVGSFTSSSQIVGVSGDTAVTIQQVGDTINLMTGNTVVTSVDPTTQRFGILGDTYITINQSTNQISLYGGNGLIATFDREGGIDFYHNGSLVAQTTADGITGAVWG